MTLHPRLAGQFRLPRWSSSSALVAVLIAIAVWGLDLSGVLSGIDGSAYDLCLRWQTRLPSASPRVLLVDVDAGLVAGDGSTLTSLARTLTALQAEKVAFTMPRPPGWQNQRGAWTDRILFGRPYHRDSSRPEQLVGASTGAHVEDDAAGIVALPPVHGGIYRQQQRQFLVDGAWAPALETVVAGLAPSSTAASAAYGIAFAGGPGSLPLAPAEMVLAGDLIPAVVRGKVVLVGYRMPAIYPGVSTPTTNAVDKMTLLELHGHALNTLLAGRAIRHLHAGHRLWLLAATALLGVLVYKRFECHLLGWPLLLALVLSLVAGTLSLWFARVWLPAVPLAIVQTFCCALVLARKTNFANLTVTRLVLDLSVKLRRRTWPTDFLSSDDPWAQVVSFIYQTLNLNRLIILELPPNAFHLREVKACHCSVADIDEQRRDFRRWPYAAALESRGPIQVGSERSFLKAVGDDENQYLAPLIFSGQLFGFLALGVERERLENFPDFPAKLQSFADGAAELLYRRHCALAEHNDKKIWVRMFGRIPEEEACAELVQSAHLLERRLGRLENMFDNLSTGTAIYDLFGRLLLMNRRLFELLQAEGVVPAELTMVDLIARLSDRGLDGARQLLRRVILEKRDESLPVTVGGAGRAFLLHVRPLRLELPQLTASLQESDPFRLQGIQCELVERGAAGGADDGRGPESTELKETLREHLAAIESVASLLENDDVSTGNLRGLGGMLQAKVDDAMATLGECRELAAEASGTARLDLPLDEPNGT